MKKEINLELDYIDFKLAKLLIKKGFNLFETYGNVSSLYDKKGNHVLYSNYGFMLSGINDGYVSAPTRTLVLKWLRLHHNVHINPLLIELLNPKKGYGYNITFIRNNDYCTTDENKSYEIPEQAIDAAIKYTIKNII